MLYTMYCDLCGGFVVYDAASSFSMYSKDRKFLIDRMGKLKEDKLDDRLVYRCYSCGFTATYTFKEVEKKIRISLAYETMETLRVIGFSKVREEIDIREESGLDYCGKCTGYDGEGNCIIDIIQACPIREG